MVTRDRTQCRDCPHYTIVRTINHPEGEMSCRFAIMPCDSCRAFADTRATVAENSSHRK